MKIDPNVTFELNDNRNVTLDAYELVKFIDALYATRGAPTGPDDPRPTITYDDVVIPEVTKMVKEKTGVDIKPSEAIGIFDSAQLAWGTKKKNWREPTATSQTSPAFTDPRFAD